MDRKLCIVFWSYYTVYGSGDLVMYDSFVVLAYNVDTKFLT